MSYNSGLLASMALFRQLYNDESNILKVIEYFIIDVIKDKNLTSFTLPIITDYVNSEYYFDIPEAIFKRCLKNLKRQLLISQNVNNYLVKDELKSQVTPNLESMSSEIQKDHRFIFDSLFAFIESNLNGHLNEDEKPEIIKAFMDYFLNENHRNNYSDFVSAYIITLKSNMDYISKLNTIKEGIIIFSGIRYGIEDDSISRLNSLLTLFLDHEILFSLNNYNGEIYFRLASEIVKYLKEINSKTLAKKGKAFIELRYLEETRKAIKKFFSAAEYAMRSDKSIEPDVIAMRYILDDCSSPADINLKEIAFFKKLSDMGILVEEPFEYYSSENMQYNAISTDLCKKISDDLNIDEKDQAFEIVNQISIRRKFHKSKNLFDSRFVLLTETGTKLRIARNENLLDSNFVPLTINTDYFVTNAWLLLNKGLGSSEHPTTFNVLTKAQITLASRLSRSVGEGFDYLKKQFDKGLISKEVATENIIQLRNQPILPEQIIEENVLDVIEGISNSEIIAKQDMFDRINIELRKAKNENESLIIENEKINRETQIEISKIKESNENLKFQLDETLRKVEVINEKERKIVEAKLRRNRKLKKASLLVLLLLAFLIYIYLSITYKFIASFFGIVGTLFTIIPGIYTLVSFVREYSSAK